MEELKPRALWRWDNMCEISRCVKYKNESGYCPRHEYKILRRRQLWERFLQLFKRNSSILGPENKRPRSPRELGLYD